MVHRRQSTALHFEPFHYSIATASHKILSSISSEKPWATRRIVMRFELSLRTEQTGSVTAHVYLYEQREPAARPRAGATFGGIDVNRDPVEANILFISPPWKKAAKASRFFRRKLGDLLLPSLGMLAEGGGIDCLWTTLDPSHTWPLLLITRGCLWPLRITIAQPKEEKERTVPDNILQKGHRRYMLVQKHGLCVFATTKNRELRGLCSAFDVSCKKLPPLDGSEALYQDGKSSLAIRILCGEAVSNPEHNAYDRGMMRLTGRRQFGSETGAAVVADRSLQAEARDAAILLSGIQDAPSRSMLAPAMMCVCGPGFELGRHKSKAFSDGAPVPTATALWTKEPQTAWVDLRLAQGPLRPQLGDLKAYLELAGLLPASFTPSGATAALVTALLACCNILAVEKRPGYEHAREEDAPSDVYRFLHRLPVAVPVWPNPAQVFRCRGQQLLFPFRALFAQLSPDFGQAFILGMLGSMAQDVQASRSVPSLELFQLSEVQGHVFRRCNGSQAFRNGEQEFFLFLVQLMPNSTTASAFRILQLRSWMPYALCSPLALEPAGAGFEQHAAPHFHALHSPDNALAFSKQGCTESTAVTSVTMSIPCSPERLALSPDTIDTPFCMVGGVLCFWKHRRKLKSLVQLRSCTALAASHGEASWPGKRTPSLAKAGRYSCVPHRDDKLKLQADRDEKLKLEVAAHGAAHSYLGLTGLACSSAYPGAVSLLGTSPVAVSLARTGISARRPQDRQHLQPTPDSATTFALGVHHNWTLLNDIVCSNNVRPAREGHALVAEGWSIRLSKLNLQVAKCLAATSMAHGQQYQSLPMVNSSKLGLPGPVSSESVVFKLSKTLIDSCRLPTFDSTTAIDVQASRSVPSLELFQLSEVQGHVFRRCSGSQAFRNGEQEFFLFLVQLMPNSTTAIAFRIYQLRSWMPYALCSPLALEPAGAGSGLVFRGPPVLEQLTPDSAATFDLGACQSMFRDPFPVLLSTEGTEGGALVRALHACMGMAQDVQSVLHPGFVHANSIRCIFHLRSWRIGKAAAVERGDMLILARVLQGAWCTMSLFLVWSTTRHWALLCSSKAELMSAEILSAGASAFQTALLRATRFDIHVCLKADLHNLHLMLLMTKSCRTAKGKAIEARLHTCDRTLNSAAVQLNLPCVLYSLALRREQELPPSPFLVELMPTTTAIALCSWSGCRAFAQRLLQGGGAPLHKCLAATTTAQDVQTTQLWPSLRFLGQKSQPTSFNSADLTCPNTKSKQGCSVELLATWHHRSVSTMAMRHCEPLALSGFHADPKIVWALQSLKQQQQQQRLPSLPAQFMPGCATIAEFSACAGACQACPVCLLAALLPTGPTRVEPAAFMAEICQRLGAAKASLAAPTAYTDVKAGHLGTADACRAQGVRFVPLVAETIGAWEPTAARAVLQVAQTVAFREGGEVATVHGQLLQHLCVLARGHRARAALRRRVELASAAAEAGV
ncbi:nipblb [Symbiodinium natans]|uniref:Nipblb protein n=1 Tax=Symbiodinium natans TaxID=878477 RepID=A0A812LVR7_9DINO|nr:nipblb [Symbiodinium natans]